MKTKKSKFTTRVKERYVDADKHYHNIVRDGILVVAVTSGIAFIFKGMIYHSIGALTVALLKDQIATGLIGGGCFAKETLTTLLHKRIKEEGASTFESTMAKDLSEA